MRPIFLPETKLDELAREVSERLLVGHYFDNEQISGEELRQFSDHPQINKFLLFQVFQVWNMQLSKLKHPYFEFEHAEVVQALNDLRNLLSQHIRIGAADFKPMLKHAVYNNLKLLLDPRQKFEDFFFPNQDTLSVEKFEKHVPFFSDMDFVVNSILRYHQKHDIQEIEKDIFFLKMEKVVNLFNQKRDITFESYRKGLLQKLLQRNIDDIIYEIEAAEQAKSREKEEAIRAQQLAEQRAREEAERQAREAEERKRQEEEALARRQNFFETAVDPSGDIFDIDLVEEPEVQDMPAPRTQADYPPVREEKPVVSPRVDDYRPPVAPPVDPPKRETEAPATIEEAISAYAQQDETPRKSVLETLNEVKKTPEPPQKEVPPKTESSQSFLSRFLKEEDEEDTSSVHARVTAHAKEERKPTLAEKFQHQQTGAHKNGQHGTEIKLNDIPIHRQYQYVQKVFEGNNVRFRIIVDKVNNAKDPGEVENIINRFVLSNDKLDRNDEVVKEFIAMLQKRF